jgi:hypothetical protein
MPSPFPGMDPYIEASGSWNNFHRTFVAECARQLNQLLPRNYAARIESRPQVEALPQDIHWLDRPIETLIHIQRFPERGLVTALEVLTPAQKSGKGRERYLATRLNCLEQQMNLVEIDLLLAGERVPIGAPLPEGHFYALVTRSSKPRQCEVFGWSVRDAMPTIAIPLHTEEGDAPLDLKAAFDRTYDGGRFHMLVHYSAPLPPELTEADREWAIRRASKRD